MRIVGSNEDDDDILADYNTGRTHREVIDAEVIND